MTEKNKNIRQSASAYFTSRKAGLEMFAGIRFRMEHVAQVNGIDFINDSKATDLESAFCSLELMEQPVTWMAGASEFDEDYSVFLKLVKFKVVTLVVFGSNDTSIKETLGVFADHYVHSTDFEDAFFHAMKYTKKGGVVLFSPACTSFEMFSDYKERGEKFNQMVNGLK
ncbi:MAG: glutamate ligase domain-containing protein [Bacteroidota bacterium]